MSFFHVILELLKGATEVLEVLLDNRAVDAPEGVFLFQGLDLGIKSVDPSAKGTANAGPEH
jgi:hypothetical protein